MKRLLRRTDDANTDESATESRLHALEARMDELAAEVQECRSLNLRLAELIDVVQELLLPVSLQDKEKVAELTKRYADGVG